MIVQCNAGSAIGVAGSPTGDAHLTVFRERDSPLSLLVRCRPDFARRLAEEVPDSLSLIEKRPIGVDRLRRGAQRDVGRDIAERLDDPGGVRKRAAHEVGVF